MEINENCPCKRKKCEHHGKCGACRAHHAQSKRQRPVACEKEKRGARRQGEAAKDSVGQMFTAREEDR